MGMLLNSQVVLSKWPIKKCSENLCEIPWKTIAILSLFEVRLQKKLPLKGNNAAFFQQIFKHLKVLTSANYTFHENTYGKLLLWLSEASIILHNSLSTK